MKKHFLILILLQLSLLQVNGQRLWSLSVANSPRIEHRGSGVKNLFYYPISPSIILDYRIADKVSLSIGTFFHYDKEINDALGIPSAFLTSKTYLYEVPLQLNYHFKDYSKKFDPFLKTTVRYSYSYVSSTFQYQEDISKSHYNNSYVLWDIGAGLNFRINKNIFLGCQLSYGLALKYTYKNFKYIEPLISLGYTFIK